MIQRVLLVAALAGCPHRERSTEPTPVKHDAAAHATPRDDDAAQAVVLPPAPPVPAIPIGLPAIELPAVVTPEAVALGELLFHDPRLSSTHKLACASCHDPAHGTSGGIDTTAAGQKNLRRTPALVNLVWEQHALGWDGRYELDDHLRAHLSGQLGTSAEQIARVLGDVPVYRAHLARIGGTPADAVVHALEAFELTRFAGDSPWDRVERSRDAPADLKAGYALFMGKARCGTCHPPPLYTDHDFHHVLPLAVEDKGRGLVEPARAGEFKTPTLRGAAARTSWFHAGTSPTLDAAVAVSLAGDKPVHLSDPELAQLQAFVRALTGDR